VRQLSRQLNLFEHAGPLLERLRSEEPFPSGAAMLARAREILTELSEAEQIAVINAHPRIGERPDNVSAASFKEQGYQDDTTPPDVFLRLATLNDEYEAKFGFRFVVFVNRRSKEAIVPLLESRLRGTRDEERRTALREILGIAEDRLSPPFQRVDLERHHSPVTDDLVARAQAGDQTAFRDLYRQHAGRVYALCLRLTGDAYAAEERTQDVFVRLWDKLRLFRGESAFSSWLHRLAVNVVMNEHRTTGRRERRVASAENPESLERHVGNSTEGLSIDLERAIAELPDGAREVFVLYDIEGYAHGEIASLTGIAEGTSKAQLFRARRLLREKLER